MNGYDVDCKYGSNHRLIAEIKCNIPVKENVFGSAQANAILKDIEQLAHPSKKTKSDIGDEDKVIRFMVLLDTQGVRPAAKHLISKAEEKGIRIIDEPHIDWNRLSIENLYVVYVPVDQCR